MFINLITGAKGGGATAGVTSLNDQKGDLKLKTVNSNDLLGEGNIEIQAGVTSVNGQEGAVVIDVPTKVSQLQNDATYQTKEQVTVSINEAMSGATGSGMELVDINNLDASGQTEFVNYLIANTNNDKYTGTKWPFSSTEGSVCGVINFSSDFSEIIFPFFRYDNYGNILVKTYLSKKSDNYRIFPSYDRNIRINSDVSICIIGKDANLDLSATGYVSLTGYSFTNLIPTKTQLFLILKKAEGESCMVPLQVVNKYYSNGSPYFYSCSFDFEGYHYEYNIQLGSTSGTESNWTFTQTSKTPLPNGNINSSEVSSIKVLTQAEYDAIDPKDEKTLYMIKG